MGTSVARIVTLEVRLWPARRHDCSIALTMYFLHMIECEITIRRTQGLQEYKYDKTWLDAEDPLPTPSKLPLGIMIGLFSILVFYLGTCTCYVRRRARCIQCEGHQIITFPRDVTIQVALDYLKASLESCATGGDYLVTNITPNGRTWTFDLKVWRYCGYNKSSFVDKKNFCHNSICAVSDQRSLTCGERVWCIGDCKVGNCGG